jgi:hypothetical protein
MFYSFCRRSIINTILHYSRSASKIVSGIAIIGSLFCAIPTVAQTVTPEVATTTIEVGSSAPGTIRQQAWLKSTVDQRIRLAEQLGDEGARTFAKAKAWTPVFDGIYRTLVQGPDQVYLGSDDLVHVIEAKGGSSQLSHAYGHPQGSTEWAVEAAKRVLRNSSATEAERRGSQLIIEAASKGKLQVHVVRTSHILGEPTAAVLEQTVHCSDEAARIAQSALDNIARTVAHGTDDAARAVDDLARTAAEGSTVTKTVAKAALPAAIVVDAGFRVRDGIKVEQQYASGMISSQQREIAHARNAAGMAGGWAGAWGGAQIGTAGGATAGTAVAPGPGTAIGGVAGGIAGGIAGYFGGEAVAAATAEWAVDRVHSAGTTVSNTANSAARSIQCAWSWALGY